MTMRNIRGLLIINAFWKSASMQQMEALLCRAAKKLGMDLNVRTNQDFLFCQPPLLPLFPVEQADFILFWDKDIRLAQQLEQIGYRLFNSARSIALCDDKTLTHLALSDAGLPMPKTILCPSTFPAIGYPQIDFLKKAAEVLSYPMIVKEGCGSFGQQVYLVRNEKEALSILQKAAGAPLLLQQFIQESAGSDIRLYMVGGQCVAAMKRRNDTDFRANIQIGGHALPYTPTADEIQLAARACQALGLSFAGVDLLHSKDGPLLCEVNSNAHFSALAALTKADVAGAILSHIQEVICKAG